MTFPKGFTAWKDGTPQWLFCLNCSISPVKVGSLRDKKMKKHWTVQQPWHMPGYISKISDIEKLENSTKKKTTIEDLFQCVKCKMFAYKKYKNTITIKDWDDSLHTIILCVLCRTKTDSLVQNIKTLGSSGV